MKYNFYYDETEHSRKINYQTVTANNYYDNFITAIVGWNVEDTKEISERYENFEFKYEGRKKNGELKSVTMKQKDFRYGFASLNKNTIEFYEDLLNVYEENTVTYLSVFSKIEYVINQLFQDYNNLLFVDIDYMKYSIIKAILVYRPKIVIESIYNNPDEFVNELRLFFEDRIEKNKSNISLKKYENESFEEILMILSDVNPITGLDWNYYASFDGFDKLLQEMNIQEYTLIIDKEGDLHNTAVGAERVGIKNVSEGDSKKFVGIRMSDMFVGLISKMMQSLKKSLTDENANENVEKTLLEVGWFILNDRQLNLYKKLYRIICINNKHWYNTYSGIYTDDLVSFVSLLQFMNHFQIADEIRSANYDMQSEYFNSYVCSSLQGHFEMIRNKIPLEPLTDDSEEFFFNQRRAKVYKDISKQPMLPIREGQNQYSVLAVGICYDGTPLVTISDDGEASCYKIPVDYSDWVMTMVGYANSGMNLLPSEVVFSLIKGKYQVDIL